MSGRGLRARSTVNYNDKQDMVPAWMKTAGLNNADSDSLPKRSKKSSSGKVSQSSAEKENSSEAKKNDPQNNKQSTAKTKPATEKKPKAKKEEKKAKAEPAAARGRNAGVAVVPIEDRKGKGPRVSGLRAPPPPAEPKEIPGLPGVVQQAPKQTQKQQVAKQDKQQQPAKSSRSGPSSKDKSASQKRKAPAAADAATPDVQLRTGLRDVVTADDEEVPVTRTASKRQRQALEAAAVPRPAPAVAAPAARNRSLPALAAAAAAAAAPLTLSPISGDNELAASLLEAQAVNAELRDFCQQLQAEIADLKESNVREEMNELLADHDARVHEHVIAANNVAERWRDEANKQATLLQQALNGATDAAVRTLRSDLATAEQAMLDMERAGAEKDKEITRLKKRNEFLERHARIPEVVDKCTATDGPLVANAAVQTRQGVHLTQARAMAPEGAAASSMYTYSEPPNAAIGGVTYVNGRVVENSFSLPGQRTAARPAGSAGAGGSDMQLGTFESVQGQAAFGLNGRRLSVPVVAGGAGGQQGLRRATMDPRAIQFYSNSAVAPAANAIGGLAAVQEDESEEEHKQQILQQHSQPASNTSGTLLPKEEALFRLTGITAQPLRHSGFRFTHVDTGYTFDMFSNPESVDGQLYRHVAWGSAENAFKQGGEGVYDIFAGEFEFDNGNDNEQRLKLLQNICKILSKKNVEQQA